MTTELLDLLREARRLMPMMDAEQKEWLARSSAAIAKTVPPGSEIVLESVTR